MSLEQLVKKYGFNIRVTSSDRVYQHYPFTILYEDGPHSYAVMYDDGTYSSVMRSVPGCNDYNLIPEMQHVA